MIDITTSGTMTERSLNHRSPIHVPGKHNYINLKLILSKTLV